MDNKLGNPLVNKSFSSARSEDEGSPLGSSSSSLKLTDDDDSFLGTMRSGIKQLFEPTSPKAAMFDRIRTLAQSSSVPKSITAVLERNPSIAGLLENVLDALEQSTSKSEMETAIGSFGMEAADAGTPPEDVKLINQMLYHFLEVKYGLGNIQFHTDSIPLMEPNSNAIGKPERFRKNAQKTQETIEADPQGELAKRIASAKTEARRQNLGETDWTMGDRLPEFGIATHAGWSGVSMPDDEEPERLFYGIRTLGLSNSSKTQTASVPLDFSLLGKIDKTTAHNLLEITTMAAEKTADGTLTNDDFKKWFSAYSIPEELALNAKPIIINFVNDTQQTITNLQKRIQS